MGPLVTLGWLALLAATPGPASPRSYAPEDVPAALAGAVQRADRAAAELQRTLSARLGEAMKAGGPANAIHACRDDAARLTAEAGRRSGAAMGRTSDRLRNPGNAPPPWAAAWVAAAAGRRAAEARPAVFDLGDRVGVLRPIPVAAPCTRCHGSAADVSPEVRSLLRRSYPGDRALGYAVGDHRGFVWVVVPK